MRFKRIPQTLYYRLVKLGIVDPSGVRDDNEGKSNYAKKIIQPWTIWIEYALNPWDADIVKRILRTKDEEGMTPEAQRILDYKKIQHICAERIRQIETTGEI